MLELKVDGMTCGHCVRAVTGAVHGVAPRAEVAVDLKNGLVRIGGADASVSADALRRAIAEEGYTVH